MTSLWRRVFAGSPERNAQRETPDVEIRAPGSQPFPIAQHVGLHLGMPIVDWAAVAAWVESIDDPGVRQRAWTACERNWLLRFRDALGPRYQLSESEHFAVVSSLEPNVVRAMLRYLERTLRRILHVLEGIAQTRATSREVLILFESKDTYYEYVSHYYPESGEFALSGGMFLRAGHGHFVIPGTELAALEPVIAHEMTHACVSHLPLPLWLNEGLAVNTEWRVAGRGPRNETPHEIHEKHLAFWNAGLIQDFWSGQSFDRTDEGTMLSYELAQTIVAQLSREWESFQAFAITADAEDGGAAAARVALDMDLGALACALLERAPEPEWSPDPARWTDRNTTPQ